MHLCADFHAGPSKEYLIFFLFIMLRFIQPKTNELYILFQYDYKKNLNFLNTSSILQIYEGDSTVAIVLYVCCGRVSLTSYHMYTVVLWTRFVVEFMFLWSGLYR